MSAPRIYLDYNATTPVTPAAARAMSAAVQDVGNPSSIHEHGRSIRDRIEESRRHVAALLSANTDEIVFTSGGTEADMLAVVGLARLASASAAARVITTVLEHPACLGPTDALRRGQLAAEPLEVLLAGVDGSGRVDLDELAELCAGPGVVVVHLANHELGVIQDVHAIANIAREAGLLVHCDAVQAAGKIPVDPRALGVDTLAISAHKLGGPKGVGALWVRRGIDLEPIAAAGHQERERRPGTENVVGIAGFGAAAQAVPERLAAGERVRALAEALEAHIRDIPETTIHGLGAPRIGNTVNARFAGASGEIVVQALDLAGISVSTGAACSSGSVEPSTVLLGLGLDPEQAASAVRFSLGPENRAEEIERVAEVLPSIVERARRFD